MVNLTGIFSRLERRKVLVIGDILLDTYTVGKARRISPEAPVAVVHVSREEHRPGGAGNVILNLISMGVEVAAVGRIGGDAHGRLLLKAFQDEHVDVRGVLVQDKYPTPVKNRIIAENQQIVRVDHELVRPISESLEQEIVDLLPGLMQGVHVVAISDYGKGFLSNRLLRAIIDQAKEHGVPVIADPKGIDFSKYRGTSIIKPNVSEAYAAANLPLDAALEEAAVKVLRQSEAEVLMLTRSEAGISLFYEGGLREDYPVKIREVKDVTGAGDTVLAMLACALANKLSVSDAAQLSNIAAGIAIEHFGCARVSLSDLARRLLELDAVNKIFDMEHLHALREALRDRKFILLGVSDEKGLTSRIFSAIRYFGQRQDCALLVYVQGDAPSEEFVGILAALHDVDFIILKGDSLKRLCTLIPPSEVYVIEGERLQKLIDSDELAMV